MKGQITMDNDILRLIAIQTKDCVYVSNDLMGNGYCYESGNKLLSCRFDGKSPKKTYHGQWFILDNIPAVVEYKHAEGYINYRLELKPEVVDAVVNLPKVINSRYLDEDCAEYNFRGLYEERYDTTPEYWEEIPFQINILDSLDDFSITKKEYEFTTSLLDKIKYHPILLPTKPCSMSSKDSYNVIRDYVRTHIDNNYAKIVTNESNHFKVEKIIETDTPEAYRVEINKGYRKKSKWETCYRKIRSAEMLNISPNNDSWAKEKVYLFSGINYNDMIANMNAYLESLMLQINKPLCDCPTCKGYGVIEKE
jgi:hypothetical protein